MNIQPDVIFFHTYRQRDGRIEKINWRLASLQTLLKEALLSTISNLEILNVVLCSSEIQKVWPLLMPILPTFQQQDGLQFPLRDPFQLDRFGGLVVRVLGYIRRPGFDSRHCQKKK
jgi:hypothetical protein